jgi:hypothetical protein
MVNFFVSRAFLIGVPVALTIYYLLPTARLQVPLLIVTSFVIFWFAAGYQVLLVCFAALVTAVTSLGAVQVQPAHRRIALWIGVGLNLAFLRFFKYKRLFIPETLYRELFGASPTMSAIYNFALPVGISFYVFNGISLIVDSYRDRGVIDALTEPPNAMTHLIKTYNYITFFPQIVGGPIVKGKAFYGQIRRKRLGDVRWWDAISALSQGYFLKEVIANNLNQSTAAMTSAVLWSSKPSVELLAMLVGYSAQIFADFAGYTLIAIGLGRLFGYELPINFHRPYFADSFVRRPGRRSFSSRSIFADRGVDEDLISHMFDPATLALREAMPIFQEENSLLNLLAKASIPHRITIGDRPSMTVAEWRKQIRSRIDYYVSGFSNPYEPDQKLLARLANQAKELEAHGAHVVFFFDPLVKTSRPSPKYRSGDGRCKAPSPTTSSSRRRIVRSTCSMASTSSAMPVFNISSICSARLTPNSRMGASSASSG